MLKLRHALLSVLLTMGASSLLAETIYVTNTNDAGTGSLRQAILDANADYHHTTILFNLPGATGAERIINVPTALPAFTAPVELRTDGAQQGKTVLKAPIINGPGAATTGLTFNASSQTSKVELITFRDFVLSITLNVGGITIQNNRFENNQGGLDIRLTNSGGNILKGNVFTTSNAVSVIAGTGGGNTIQGNSFTGGGINLGSTGNIIGGLGSADANTFTNTLGDAIVLSNGSGAKIQHNTIHGSAGVAINVSGTDMTIEYNNLSGNVGYDITVANGHSNKINFNQITGDNGVFNGITLKDGVSYVVNNNWVSGGSIELTNMSASSNYGQLRITSNTIVNDPSGFSAHGAITLNNTTSAFIIGNTIHHNAGNGVFLYGSSYNTIFKNEIYENGRTGVNVGSALYNRISQNTINNNHADAGGGRTGIFATGKAAPVVTSAKRVGNNFVITGSGTVANDSVQIFVSDALSRIYSLTQNAYSYKAGIVATGSTWSVTVPAGLQAAGEVYFNATATDINNTTSSFSKAVGVEINGPVQATTNQTSYYYAENIPGASYSWWSSLPYSSMTQNGNTVQFNFNQVGTGTVSVGYTDPTTGQWKMYSLTVSVMGPARFGILEEAAVTAEVYPNPFAASTKIKLNAISGGGNADLNLYNMNGEIVFQSKGHKEGDEVEVGNNLESGMYTLQIVTSDNIKSVKIIKN